MLEVASGDLRISQLLYHSKYAVSIYARNNWYQNIPIQVTTNSTRADCVRSRLDEEEDVKSIEFGGGIKMKKTTRKFRFVLR